MNTGNHFTITLTALQALQTKVGYEAQGYTVNMQEIAIASFIDHTFKYRFILSNNNNFNPQNSTVLIQGATA